MKKFIAILLALLMIAGAVGCDNAVDATNSLVTEITEDEVVKRVKEGHPNAYPDITYDEAFGGFFTYPSWRHFTGTRNGSDEDGDGEPDTVEENVEIVEFTGRCMYQDVEVKVLIQFQVNDDNTFETVYCSFNEVPQNVFVMVAVMEKAFETAYEKRYGELPSSSEDETDDDFWGSFDWSLDEESIEADENQAELYQEYAEPEEPMTDEDGEIIECYYLGQINTHGGTVAGYKSSYVIDGGKVAKVRKSLGNGWHVTVNRYCYTMDTLWYELYDSDDGDYYGWVDADYVDLYE